MPFLNHNKDFDNFMQVFLRDQQRYEPIVKFTDNVTQQLSQLSWADCELIAIEVSKTNQSEFCTGIHTGISHALVNDPENNIDIRKLNPALAFARKLNHDAASINQADIQSVRDAGWNDQTIEDIVGLVAIIRFYNTVANGLGFKGLADDAFREMGEATVQQRGFLPMFQSYLRMADSEN